MDLGCRSDPRYVTTLSHLISRLTFDMLTGVNLGGWLITEPFIVPALYEKYQNVAPPATPAVDEWTLSIAMRNDTGAGGGIEQLEEHYKTFIVRHACTKTRPSLP